MDAQSHAQVIREALLDFSTESVPGEITPRCAEALAALAALVSDLAAAREALQRQGVQADVREFHEALDIPIGESPAIRSPELRASLIEEEAAETCAAIRGGDLVEAIDGLCDLLCVTYGAAVEFGVALAPFWREVHRTNMAKVGGPVREDGKRLKPDGWTPPDIAGVLAALAADGGKATLCDKCFHPEHEPGSCGAAIGTGYMGAVLCQCKGEPPDAEMERRTRPAPASPAGWWP